MDMNVIDQGHGSPVIFFIHGFLCAAEDWNYQIDRFQGRHRTIAPTFRGHNGSLRGSEKLSIDQIAKDCIALIEKLKLKEIVLVGHSLGTRIAFDISSKIPDRITGLVLIEGSRLSESGAYKSQLEAFKSEVKKQGYQNFISQAFSAMVSNSKYDQFREKLVYRALAVPQEWAIELRSSAIVYDSDSIEYAIQQAQMPILLIQSTDNFENQMFHPLKQGDGSSYASLIKANSEDADIIHLVDTGHFAQIEALDQVNSAIEHWMQKRDIT